MILKFDARLGLVFGWAIISKKTIAKITLICRGDIIPEDAMLEASIFWEKP
jgi:hypothetical protein